MISPAAQFRSRWFAPHVAYTTAKYGMSLCVLGMAEEFRGEGIAVNDQAPPRDGGDYLHRGPETLRLCRKPETWRRLARHSHSDARSFTGGSV